MPARAVESVLGRLQELHPQRIDLSLERIRRLLDALGAPHKSLPKTLHIAGTNGKGSTAAFLRAMLEADGRRVHVYSSPHLIRFNERIRLAGALVADQPLIAALEECLRANAGLPITYFEITTAAAFLLFAQTPGDWLVLETGLGGRVDAANVVDHPAACLITPVSMDHTEFLGASIEAITTEKAGIFKPGAPAFLGRQHPRAEQIFRRCAARLGTPHFFAELDFFARAENGRFIFEDAGGLLDLPAPRLVGRHQFDNAALAIAALRHVAPHLGEGAMAQGMRDVQWPGRLQPLTRGALKDLCPAGAELWVDGGHNPDGARVLSDAIGEMETRAPKPLVLVCGMLAGKNTHDFLQYFIGLAERAFAIPVQDEVYGRGSADVMGAARALSLSAQDAPDLHTALRKIAAHPWPTPPRILICGSLYLAGAALAANGELLN